MFSIFSAPLPKNSRTFAPVSRSVAVLGVVMLAASTLVIAQDANAQDANTQDTPQTDGASNGASTGQTAGKSADAPFVTIFDGKSLAGWQGDREWFRVEDGAIVAGKLDQDIPNNWFLSTQKRYGDFELRVEVKLVGQGNNAGVQFRTERIPDHHEVIGYQADIGMMGDRSIWGSLYDESRRRKFLAENPDVSNAALKPGDWNEIRVVAKGPKIQIFLNGQQTVDYTETEPKIPKDGVIAVQVHSGKPLEAWYRNIRIREL
ncbi:3-keto-disaccharide hydrolase [Stieleria varia]|uniref:3-keto-alpha-glucoside-1,2-lyase/3-keto-2-hydroxy-glucal hydratase domain-containing protein n=1 Tax=Stieleria varia TaxID=2528005 RepID=A0A5C6AQZ9_9BACT|nr:DUF1080 domain-containing protein [Stieleria varia]TWU02150.1 hypothetical protein Pla52n_31990 [Stieleria varia]